MLFAYVLAAFLAQPDWGAVLRATFLPHIECRARIWRCSWRSSEPASLPTCSSGRPPRKWKRSGHGAQTVTRKGATPEELRKAADGRGHRDALSNLIMYFIIMTTAATLHAHGITDIATAKQAAEALRPVAGNGRVLLFTLGDRDGSAGGAGACRIVRLCDRGGKGGPGRSRTAAGSRRSSMRCSRVACCWDCGSIRRVRRGEDVVLVGRCQRSAGAATGLSGGAADRQQESDGPARQPPLLRWLGWITGVVMSVAAVAMFVAG